jgi:hypothetical protein
MIFQSRNESRRKKYDWIMSLPVGAYFVTRRLKPVKVGKVIAIQPGRGKKAGCWAEVLSCERHKEIYNLYEIILEGFRTEKGLLDYFIQHKIDIDKTYRILMRKVK